MTVLLAHTRGDTFKYSSTLGGSWLVSDFTGGFKFTLRTAIPPTSVVNDADAGVVAQASVATGEITFSGADFTITIPKEVTTLWPAKTLQWDLQGVVTANGYCKTIDRGTIQIVGDVTRSA
jgi:hypothetical protein